MKQSFARVGVILAVVLVLLGLARSAEAFQANGGGIPSSGSGTVTGVTGTAPIVSSGGTAPAISLSGVTAEQGNGAKVQLSTGSTTTGDLAKYDSNGNAIDAGSAPALSGANITSATIPKAALGFSTQPYEMHEGIPGTPSASLVIPDTCAQTVTFPANLTTPTSYVSCGTNPSENDDYIIKVAGSQIADISISTSCVATLNTVSHTTQSCTAGQRIEVDGPATVSGANISIVVVGTRAL
jgi:hypothetical protein